MNILGIEALRSKPKKLTSIKEPEHIGYIRISCLGITTTKNKLLRLYVFSRRH